MSIRSSLQLCRILSAFTVTSLLASVTVPAAEYYISTLAGIPPGSADGAGANARFFQPCAMATDDSGNVYVADTGNNTIRRITSAGVTTTLAGSPGVSGNTDGVGSVARFSAPFGVAADKLGNVYVADTSNHTIRKITSTGVVTTLAGIAGQIGYTDGAGSAARFASPMGWQWTNRAISTLPIAAIV